MTFDGLASPIYIGIFDWPTQAGGLPIVGTGEDARASFVASWDGYLIYFHKPYPTERRYEEAQAVEKSKVQI